MAFDKKFVPEKYCKYGTADFQLNIIPEALKENMTVIDVGGGKAPHITPKEKEALNLKVIGLDIDENELQSAPAGIYDEIRVADITKYVGEAVDGDLIVSRALLEHVNNVPATLENMTRMIKPGARIAVFAPCRNAWFARINMIIPQKWKVKLINALYTEKVEEAHYMGFKAYYDHCVPSKIEKIADSLGLQIIEKRLYYMSNYFAFFTPLYIFWRSYQFIVIKMGVEDLCEGFSYIFEKKLKN